MQINLEVGTASEEHGKVEQQWRSATMIQESSIDRLWFAWAMRFKFSIQSLHALELNLAAAMAGHVIMIWIIDT